MAYRLDINENFSVYRSGHTGAIGFWERNTIYGYYAAREYLPIGQKLTLAVLDRWAERAGETPEIVREKYVAMVRKDGNGMIPKPDFHL